MTSHTYRLPADSGTGRQQLWQTMIHRLSVDVHRKFGRPYAEILVTITVRGVAKPRGPF